MGILNLAQMKGLVRAYFEEAKWFQKGYITKVDEYMKVASVSSSYFLIAITAFIGMGEEVATREAFEWFSCRPKIVTALEVICRLMNDIVSHKVRIYTH